nr:MAG TPA: hypothetical protein [Caudoviricetes sp.]
MMHNTLTNFELYRRLLIMSSASDELLKAWARVRVQYERSALRQDEYDKLRVLYHKMTYHIDKMSWFH